MQDRIIHYLCISTGDIYSLGIILQQIILRCEAYDLPGEDGSHVVVSKREIVMEVQRGVEPPLRPRVPRVACSNEVGTFFHQHHRKTVTDYSMMTAGLRSDGDVLVRVSCRATGVCQDQG